MQSVHPQRAPRGQARLEVTSNITKITKVAANSANLKIVWERLKADNLVTVAYVTFCKAYREVFSDNGEVKEQFKKTPPTACPEQTPDAPRALPNGSMVSVIKVFGTDSRVI